jgi:prepilin-type N-terminal cleavage/methylation domain-containing protein
MNVMRNANKGFTLIELLLTVAIIGLIGSIVMVGNRNAQERRRDVKRVANATELQKALALYLAKQQSYPTMNGCIDGGASDTVTPALIAGAFIAPSSKLFDPLYPSDTSKCYFYSGGGATYTLRYTLEANSSAGTPGDHIVVP